MGKSLEPVSLRILLLQMLSHALIFAGQNAGNFAERALLAGDVAATAALGRSWTAFCLLSAFTASMVNVWSNDAKARPLRLRGADTS